MDLRSFRKLPPRERALVAMAVLWDGREAASFLETDAQAGALLRRSAADLAAQSPELRMPFLGSVLREAIRVLTNSLNK